MLLRTTNCERPGLCKPIKHRNLRFIGNPDNNFLDYVMHLHGTHVLILIDTQIAYAKVASMEISISI